MNAQHQGPSDVASHGRPLRTFSLACAALAPACRPPLRRRDLAVQVYEVEFDEALAAMGAVKLGLFAIIFNPHPFSKRGIVRRRGSGLTVSVIPAPATAMLAALSGGPTITRRRRWITGLSSL